MKLETCLLKLEPISRQSLRDMERVRSTDPDDSDATAPGRGGDRRNGVAEDHFAVRKNFRISSGVWHSMRRLYPSSARSAREMKLMSCR